MLVAIRNIRASRVNLLMNDIAAGLPSPLAILSLGSAIAGDIGFDRWSVRVLPILHAVTISPGRTKPEWELKNSAYRPVEIPEDLIGTVTLSILLDIPGLDDLAALDSAFDRRTIAGGAIQNRQVDIRSIASDTPMFPQISRGFALLPPENSDLIQVSAGDTESLRTLAEGLFPATPELKSGWTVPAAIGYRLLEDPATAPRRSGVRSSDTPHVFAEPLTGVAELVSIRTPRLTSLTQEAFPDLAWSWRAEGDLITGHSAYHETLVHRT